MAALVFLLLVAGGVWFVATVRREYRRGRAEDDLRDAFANVKLTISSGPFPDDADRDRMIREHKNARAGDAFQLIIRTTGIPVALHADLLSAVRLVGYPDRLARFEEVLGEDEWSWPWFQHYSDQLRDAETMLDDWDELGPRPAEPTTVDEFLQRLQFEEFRRVLLLKGPLPKPAPRSRDDFERLIRQTCTVRELADFFAETLREEQDEWDAESATRKIRFLLGSILSLRDSLMVLDEARESEPEPDPEFPEWREERSKIVAGGCRDSIPAITSLGDRFNSGAIRTIPPYFPSDPTDIEYMPHSVSPTTGRFMKSIPATAWEPVRLDLRGHRKPRVEPSVASRELVGSEGSGLHTPAADEPRYATPGHYDSAQRLRVNQRASEGENMSDKDQENVEAKLPGGGSLVVSTASLSVEATRLIKERPSAWEYLLFAEVLDSAVADVKTSHRAAARSTTVSGRPLSEQAAMNELSACASEAVKPIESMDRLVNVDLQAALGPPGQSGDAGAIVSTARGMARAYASMLAFKERVSSVRVPPRIAPLAAEAARMLDGPCAELEGYGARLKQAITKALAAPPGSEEQSIELAFRMKIDNQARVMTMLRDTRRAIGMDDE
jgi:hypothetical protein